LHLSALPADQFLAAIESTSQLPLWLDKFTLQDSESDDILAVFWSDSCEPNTLSSLIFWNTCRIYTLTILTSSSVDHKIRRELVTTNMTDEVDTDTAWSLVVQVAV